MPSSQPTSPEPDAAEANPSQPETADANTPRVGASWPGGIPPVDPRPRSSWPGAPRPADAATQDSGESPASSDSRPQTAKRTPSRHDASRGTASRGTSRSLGPRRGPIDTPRGSRAIATLVLAVLAAILVWVVATPIAGLDLHAGGWSISPGAIIPAVLVPGILAWVLRIAFEPSPRGPLIWTIITVVVLALSLLGPVVMGASGPILLALLTMHVVVGIVLVVGLRGPRGTVHVSRTPRAQQGVGPL